MPNEFLHSHPCMEVRINLDEGHVIVDRADWLESRKQQAEIDRLNAEIIHLKTVIKEYPAWLERQKLIKKIDSMLFVQPEEEPHA